MHTISAARKFVALLCLGLIACPGGDRPYTTTTTSLAGRVVKGPVRDATVTAYDPVTGIALGSGRSDETGAFEFDVPPSATDIRVCTAGGAYVEEATATYVQLAGGTELCAVALSLTPAERRQGVYITPWSHLAAARAAALQRGGLAFRDAHTRAAEELEQVLSCGEDLLSVEPIDPTVAGVPAGLTPGLRAGLLLGGLSHLAKIISEDLRITPGVRVTAITLTEALARDVATDGVFDGLAGGEEPVSIQNYNLRADTLRGARAGLANALRQFLASDRNATTIRAEDVVDWLNCLASGSGPLFRDGGGGGSGGFDIAPPVVTFKAPAVGAVVTGDVPLLVEASDASTITTLEFPMPQPIAAGEMVIEGTTATLTGTLTSGHLPSGPFKISVTAADELGNRATTELQLALDHNAPQITILAPSKAAALQGVTKLEASASDAQGIARLELSAPPDLLGDVTDTDSKPERWIADWDTRGWPDGEVLLAFDAQDGGGTVSTATVSATVDNADAGIVAGCALLESPLLSATVTACPLDIERGTCGSIVATTTTDPNGCWQLVIPDSVRGWLLVRATGGKYSSATTGNQVTVGDFAGLWTAVPYIASRPPARVENVSLNAYTSFAVQWAMAQYNAGDDLEASLLLAYQLVGEHLGRGAAFDITRTYPRDFVTSSPHAGLRSEAATRLGMAHVGLAQFGADVALARGAPIESVSSVDVVKMFYADAASGLFDGKGTDGLPLSLLGQPPDSNSLRWQLTRSIIHWLESARNTSGLTVAQMSQRGGYLEGITENPEVRLFGPDTPVQFDRTPPTIVVQLLDALGNPLDLATPVVGVVTLEVRAADQSGFPNGEPISVRIDNGSTGLGANQLPPPDRDAILTIARYSLATTALGDGPHTIVVVAGDVLGNTTGEGENAVGFRADNTPPDVAMVGPGLVNTTSIAVSTTFSDTVGPVRLEYRIDGLSHTTVTPASSPHAQTLPITCDRRTPIEVVARDAAGHTRASGYTVTCDNRAPAIARLPSATYGPEDDTNYVFITVHPTSFTITRNQAVDISQGQPTIAKYRHTYYGREKNMPALNFDVRDGGTIATGPAALQIAYRYESRTADGQPLVVRRDWTTIPAAAAGTYSLELAPEVLADTILQSTPQALHVVRIRARDDAGNEAQHEYSFRLRLLPTPLIVSGCGIASELRGTTVRQKSLHVAYTGGDIHMFNAQLYWPTGGRGTTTPLSVTPGGGVAKTAISAVDGLQFDISSGTNIRLRDPSLLPSPYDPPTWWLEGPDTGTYGPDLHGTVRPYFRLGDCEPNCSTLPNDPLNHSMAYAVEPVAPGDGAAVFLSPDTPYTLQVRAKSPRIMRSGATYAWPQDHGQYALSYAQGSEATKMIVDTYCSAQRCWEDCKCRPTCKPCNPDCQTCTTRCVCDAYTTEYVYFVRSYSVMRYIEAVQVDISPLALTARETTYNQVPQVILKDPCAMSHRYTTTTAQEAVTAY